MKPVQEYADCDVSALTAWITAIPFEEWPQQSLLEDGRIRPAMVTDLSWHGFGKMTSEFASASNRMLSVVMPGHSIPPHQDQQDLRWITRVHVPLTTNDKAVFIADGETFHMKVGKAYRVNTLAEHEVRNDGLTPRIHFIFDVLRGDV